MSIDTTSATIKTLGSNTTASRGASKLILRLASPIRTHRRMAIRISKLLHPTNEAAFVKNWRSRFIIPGLYRLLLSEIDLDPEELDHFFTNFELAPKRSSSPDSQTVTPSIRKQLRNGLSFYELDQDHALGTEDFHQLLTELTPQNENLNLIVAFDGTFRQEFLERFPQVVPTFYPSSSSPSIVPQEIMTTTDSPIAADMSNVVPEEEYDPPATPIVATFDVDEHIPHVSTVLSNDSDKNQEQDNLQDATDTRVKSGTMISPDEKEFQDVQHSKPRSIPALSTHQVDPQPTEHHNAELDTGISTGLPSATPDSRSLPAMTTVPPRSSGPYVSKGLREALDAVMFSSSSQKVSPVETTPSTSSPLRTVSDRTTSTVRATSPVLTKSRDAFQQARRVNTPSPPTTTGQINLNSTGAPATVLHRDAQGRPRMSPVSSFRSVNTATADCPSSSTTAPSTSSQNNWWTQLKGIKTETPATTKHEDDSTVDDEEPPSVLPTFSGGTSTRHFHRNDFSAPASIDTHWESYNRETTPMQPSPDDIYRHRDSQVRNRTMDDLPIGDWRHFRFVPGEPLSINRSGVPGPWRAMHPDFGPIICHPISILLSSMDPEVFLSQFRTPWNKDLFKSILYHLPSFDTSSGLAGVFPWWSRFVQACASFHIYVPPLHTLEPGTFYGTWFPRLSEFTRMSVTEEQSGFLLTVLRNSKLGLIKHATIAHLMHNVSDGYQALYMLASLAQHPRLVTFTNELQEPRQTSHDSLGKYTHEWLHFLYYKALEGDLYSDRWFYKRFNSNVHPVCRPLIEPLERDIAAYAQNTALPPTFSPSNIFVRLHTTAVSIKKPRLVDETPRDFAKPQRETSHPITLRALQEADTESLQVAELSSTGRSRNMCLACRGSHLTVDCSTLKDLFSSHPELRSFMDTPGAIPLLRKLQPRGDASRTFSPKKAVHQLIAALTEVQADSPESGEDENSSQGSTTDSGTTDSDFLPARH